MGGLSLNPFDIVTGVANAWAGNKAAGASTKGIKEQRRLDPALANLGGQMAGLGQGALGDLSGFLGGGYQDALSRQYNLYEGLQQEGRDAATMNLENRLFQQGRLGSVGGSTQQKALQGAFIDQQAQNQARAMGDVQNYMKMLSDMGAGMFGTTAPYMGITDPNDLDLSTGQMTEEAQARLDMEQMLQQTFDGGYVQDADSGQDETWYGDGDDGNGYESFDGDDIYDGEEWGGWS